MAIENLQLLPLSNEEAKFETLQDMREEFYSFEKLGLEGLFRQLTGGENEV